MSYALLVGFYQEPAPARMQEYLACLERNAAHERIDEIHVFVEQAGDAGALAVAYPILRHPKVRVFAHGRRTTYHEWLDHANRALAGRRAIVANADIHFDHTLARLDDVDLAGRIACLSRWDVLDDGSLQFFDHPSSQDAWIFQVPTPRIACDFPLGLLGCDNRFAWEAQAAGLVVFNPARSVHACHLHRSQVRRYTEQQRLHGSALSIAATTLGTPWLSVIVPCMGRLAQLRATLDSLAGQRGCTCYVVDYSCPEGAGDWTHRNLPGACVVRVPGRQRYHAAEARNRGAHAADEDAILCFLDPGLAAPCDLAARILAELPAKGYIVLRDAQAGTAMAIACHKADFLQAGGYDEVLLDPGEDHEDLAHRLRLSGLAERVWSLEPGAAREAAEPDWALGDGIDSAAIQAGYRRVKAAILEETGLPSETATLRRIYRDIARHRLRQRGLAPALPVARVAFAEGMGYVVSQLAAGVSSHTNFVSPLAAIPEPLAGKPFTQVVADRAAHIEVEFLTPGKLYVLIGTGWYGYRPMTEWISAAGYREALPAVTTALGTAFEIWSVIGEAGERLVIPSQAMLVAAELRRRA
jgi:hypothetical protein